MQPSPTQIFNTSWQIYKKIVLYGYMHHGLLAARLCNHMVAGLPHNMYTMLDIGCGDASAMIPLFSQCKPAYYKGIDLSAPAVELARNALSAMGIPCNLEVGDMFNITAQQSAPYHLVHSSFAIHHLPDEGKRHMLSAGAAHLEPGGLFVYTDVFRQPGQTRSRYIQNYLGHIQEAWHHISPEEKDLVTDHIVAYDFPADIGDVLQWIAESNLQVVDEYWPDERHAMLVMVSKQKD
jgi:2-polyprenyl-3-methyl-5-hydroxy-6-metoxy-1,4-benzoquinol methylase